MKQSAQFQTIYRQDYIVPVCVAEYTHSRDYWSASPPPWDVVELKPGYEPKVQKDRPKRFPVHVEPPAKNPTCHPYIRKLDRSVTAGFKPIEPEPPSFKFVLGKQRPKVFKQPRTEYYDTIHKFGRKVMMNKVRKEIKRKFFGKKKTQFLC